MLDRTKASDGRIIGSAIGDMNGYLPTHLGERSQPQGADPVWNDEHCRNRRIMIDDVTRNALLSDRPATLATYRMELGDKYIPVKNVFVPLVRQGPPLGQFRARLPRRLSRGRIPAQAGIPLSLRALVKLGFLPSRE